MKTKLYYTTFRSGCTRPQVGGEELRVSNNYNPGGLNWQNSFYSGNYLSLYNYTN